MCLKGCLTFYIKILLLFEWPASRILDRWWVKLHFWHPCLPAGQLRIQNNTMYSLISKGSVTGVSDLCIGLKILSKQSLLQLYSRGMHFGTTFQLNWNFKANRSSREASGLNLLSFIRTREKYYRVLKLISFNSRVKHELGGIPKLYCAKTFLVKCQTKEYNLMDYLKLGGQFGRKYITELHYAIMQ